MMMQAVVLLALLAQSQGYSWSNYISRGHSGSSSSTAVFVSTKTFEKTKAKYDGRLDLTSMVDEDEGLNDYFKEADAEEVDPPKVGQTITGSVIEIDDNGALLEIGGKMSGYLPIKEAALIPIKHMNEVIEIGQDITAEVIGTLRGMPVISLRSTQLISAWEEVLKVRASDESFEVTVLEVNKGGAVCSAFGLKAFLPGSHFVGVPDEGLIGTRLTVSLLSRLLHYSYRCMTLSDASISQVKFLDVIEEEGKVVISQRRHLSDAAPTLIPGEVVGAKVTGLRNYGAFLELDGGSAGLLHISQISADRIDNLETLFTVGQRVKVMILSHDKLNGRVALSTKALEPNGGDMMKDMNAVFEKAESTAKRYNQRLDAERTARETAAKDIVAGLGGAIEGDGSSSDANSDPLVSVAQSIESILASIVSDSQ